MQKTQLKHRKNEEKEREKIKYLQMNIKYPIIFPGWKKTKKLFVELITQLLASWMWILRIM